MPLEEAFLDDIVANPDDDAPRLVYADWLDEQGGPHDRARAEFIRLQCELPRLRPDDPRSWALDRRADDLLARYGRAWSAPLRELALAEEFARGFVEGVTLSPRRFLDHAEDVFRAAPVRRLRLGGPAGEPGALAAALVAVARSPLLGRVTSLRLGLPLSEEAAEAFASAPHLTRLTELEVRVAHLHERGVRLLVSSPHFPRLVRLSLAAGSVEPGALLPFAEGPPGALRSLTLRGHGLAPDSLGALLASAPAAGLTELALAVNTLSPEGVRAVASAPCAGRLESLNLGGNSLGDDGARAWAESAPPGRLCRLTLSYNGIRAPGITALASAPALATVTMLDLRGNVTADDGLASLASSPHASRLRALLLHFNAVGDEGARALAESPLLPDLAWLDLTANRIGPLGARALADSPYLPRLTRLQLLRNDVGEFEKRALRDRFGAGVEV
jgi:uncharacterized protein (TIGR02996 family)